jgi:predicted DNA-binding protein (UPF0251 family)
MKQMLQPSETQISSTEKQVCEIVVSSQKDIPNKDIDISDNSRDTISATVADLAALSPRDFDLKHKEVAKEMGVQVKTLDAEVKTARGYGLKVAPLAIIYPPKQSCGKTQLLDMIGFLSNKVLP